MNVKDALLRKNNNLDLVRIILASVVIFGHTILFNGDGRLWVDPIQYFTNFTYSSALCVKIFFFISGLVVTNSLLTHQNPVQYTISRIFRILPGLWFVVIITAVVIGPLVSIYSAKEYFQFSQTYRYVLWNARFKQELSLPGVFLDNNCKLLVNGALWTLRYEIGCYLALLGLFLITPNKKIYKIICAAILISVFLYPVFLQILQGIHPENYLPSASFALGALYCLFSEKINLTIANTLGLFIIYYLLKDTIYAEPALILFASHSVLLLSVNSSFRKFRVKYDISYGIYVWGSFIQQIVFFLFGHMYGGFHFLISLFLSIIMGFISFKLIEQPAIHLGKKLSLKVPVFRRDTAKA